jgi:acyl-CoA thioesterase II
VGALQTDTALSDRDGRLFMTLSRDWEIWGPNGGYVAAIALRAAGMRAPAGHRPATISAQYLSVAKFEEIEAVVEPVKQGRSAWCINVALMQAGKRFLQAQVWTTDRSDGPAAQELTMPDVPSYAGLKSWAELQPRPRTETRRFFWDNFEGRPIAPRQGWVADPRGAVVQEWYRYVDFDAGGDVFLDCARPLILIDTLQWPAHNRSLSAQPGYIAPSLDVSVWFHQPPGSAEWLLADVHAPMADKGLIHGAARLWSADGRLLATGGSNMLVTPVPARAQ